MNTTLIIAVAAVGLVGCLILLFLGLSMLREQRGGKPRPDEAARPEQEAAPSAIGGALSAITSRVTRASSQPHAHEVLRVLRDHLTGRLFVEIAGKRYNRIGELQDPEIRQGLLTTLVDLQRFAGEAAPAPAQTPHAAPAELAPETPSRPTPGPPPGVPAPPEGAPLTHAGTGQRPPPLARPNAPASPLPPPTMNPFKQMQVLREMAKNPPPPPRTITEQIDDILQTRLHGTDHTRRGIRMRAGPKGNAVFELDGAAYESVDDVPDPEVRSIIRESIAEWEKSQ